jgi:hypothetical protein
LKLRQLPVQRVPPHGFQKLRGGVHLPVATAGNIIAQALRRGSVCGPTARLTGARLLRVRLSALVGRNWHGDRRARLV